MPKLLYDTTNERYSLTMPTAVVEALGWEGGNMIHINLDADKKSVTLMRLDIL